MSSRRVSSWASPTTFPSILMTVVIFCVLICVANYTMIQKIFFSPSFLPKNEETSENEKWDRQFPMEVHKTHKIAGLSCTNFGGPSDDKASEMVYWEDVPSDALYMSPFKDPKRTKYLTFEPDRAGWNNIRMGLETIIAMAHAMGRTLVLPPDREIWAMNQGKQRTQKKAFSFDEFYHLESLSEEHFGLDIITMEEFLQRVAINQGAFKTTDPTTDVATTIYPPGNRTKWDGEHLQPLYDFLRNPNVAYSEKWDPDKCLAAFPQSTDPNNLEQLQQALRDIEQSGNDIRAERHYVDHPTPVNASTFERMAETIGRRRQLCLYGTEMQNALVVHFREDYKEGYRLLTHFYGFMFFQHWTHDLWTKRFVRDHIRYNDEIVCAAARVVDALRTISASNNKNHENAVNADKENSNIRGKDNDALEPSPTKMKRGEFHTMHVRRNDFSRQYKDYVVDAQVVLENSRDELPKGAILFIASDEKDSSYFDPLREDYQVYLLKDFAHLLEDVNTNLYSLIDQLVAARGKTFHGVYLSTFTGYINRLRGYYSTKEKLQGYEQGIIESYHFVKPNDKFLYRQYKPFRNPSFLREYPLAWRDIDRGIDELNAML